MTTYVYIQREMTMGSLGMELFALLVIILAAIDGYYKGFTYKLHGLVRLICIIVVAVALAPVTLNLIKDNFADYFDPGLRQADAVLSALVISLIFVPLILKSTKVLDYLPETFYTRRVAGALLGILFGIILVWWGLVTLSFMENIAWCIRFIEYVEKSPILSFVSGINPLSFIL